MTGRREVEDAVVAKDELDADAFTYLARAHILGAAEFARRCLALEAGTAPPHGLPDDIAALRAFSLAAITGAVAYLEASVNELFYDVSDSSRSESPQLRGLTARRRARLAEGWRTEGAERLPVLGKFQFALVMAGCQSIPQGERPYQDAELLVQLRNLVIHHSPQRMPLALDGEPKGNAQAQLPKLSRKYKGKFTQSPLTPGRPFFPNCLGGSCARWSVASAIAFADEFFRRLRLKSPTAAIVASLAM